MKQQRTVRELQERWEQAIERAAEETASVSELEREILNAAAGLHVQSGLKSGGWTDACSGEVSCGTCICEY